MYTLVTILIPHLSRKRHGPIQRIICLVRLVHRVPIPTLVRQPDAIARQLARREHVVRRVQPRVGRAEHHLPHVVETMVDVIPRLGRAPSPSLSLSLIPAAGHDGLANAVETVEGVKHGDGVRTGRVRVWAEEDESVVAGRDERGPFEVGEGAVDGIVRRFFGDEFQRSWWARVEVEELERGVVLDVYLTWFCDGWGSLEYEREVEGAEEDGAQLDERERRQ